MSTSGRAITNRWTGATGSDFRIKRDPANLTASAVARSTQALGVANRSSLNMKALCIAIVFGLLLATNVVALSVEPCNKVDEFSFIRCDDELMRMFHYRDYLNDNPAARGYLIVYGGQHDRRRSAEAHAARLKDLLINNLGIAAQRFTIIVDGYRDQWAVELWACSADTPNPTPKPTLKPNEIRFSKGRVKRAEFRWSSQCS